MKLPRSFRNSRGFTLAEVMVAILIIMVGLLALLQSVNLAIEHNLKNHQRQEVAQVAEDVMHAMRADRFDAVFNPYTTVPSKMRMMNRKYTVRRIAPITGGMRKYQVDVRWAYKNYSATHSIVSVRGQ